MKKKIGIIIYGAGILLSLFYSYLIIWAAAIELYGGTSSFIKACTFGGNFFAPPLFGVILNFHENFIVNTLLVLAGGTIISIVAEKMTGMHDSG
jgi:hypothetical protein